MGVGKKMRWPIFKSMSGKSKAKGKKTMQKAGYKMIYRIYLK